MLSTVVLILSGLAWEPANQDIATTLGTHSTWVSGVAFAPDGKTLASGSADRTVKLWRVETGELQREFRGHVDYVAALAFAPAGDILATAGYDKTARLWDVSSGKLRATLVGHRGVVTSVAFAPDGAVLATGCIDGSARLWDVTKGQMLAELKDHMTWVNAVRFSPDGRVLATGSSDGTIKLWSLRTRQVQATLSPRKGEIRALAFSPDGQTLAVGLRYATAQLWDLANLRLRGTLQVQSGDVWSVAFAPDGKTLATGDSEADKPGNVTLWDVPTLHKWTAYQHKEPVLSVAFSPDGSLLASGSWDGTVKYCAIRKLLSQKAQLTAAGVDLSSDMPNVIVPPESFFQRVRERDRDAARKFYKKYVDVKGLPVAAADEVADEALQRTYHIVTHILAGRPDILEAMVKNKTRLIIIGKDQVYTDMPEYRNSSDSQYLNERVRGTGGFDVTSFGEENLLNLPIDRYDDESIGVHEFCHTIDAALSRIDSTWRTRLRQTYRSAIGKGLWKNAYTASNPAEYWAEICQSYFDCNRINNWNHAAIGTREQLKQYDPEGYELVRKTFKLTPANDWRYRPLRQQPSVGPPPARFKIDPYYAKFTYAREFTVLGSQHVSDAALLKANDTVRKMFAYRHDILKTMIADGARLVVLGRSEKLSELPEFKEAKNQPDFEEVRYLDYSPRLKLLVVPEENVLCLPQEPFAGKCMVISAFAKGLYHVTAQRPTIPDFDKRRDRQQYELRVQRLDVEFDQKLQKLFEGALASISTEGHSPNIGCWWGPEIAAFLGFCVC
jgi:dipeptidyl aminopeptidase/acylaminoacyl peptidase